MTKPNESDLIRIILVDDIVETRETIKKMLAFEADFKVIGSAGNGREGVELAIKEKPDIVMMDINMPDMDGLEAASHITKSVPTTGVIMMSVQDDADYMQRAMLAGARFFLPKPVNMDQLYNTIRTVYDQYKPIRDRMKQLEDQVGTFEAIVQEEKATSGDRAGHVIAVYSPQGGSGSTMIATSLASGLMKDGAKTLLIDCDLQYGDVATTLAIKPQTTVFELTENENDLDYEYFDSVLATHDSGIKVLAAPPRPNFGAELRDIRPESIANVIQQVAGYYDFIILDLSKSIDAVIASLLEIASKIVLITLPTLQSIKNTKLVLDLFDQTGFDAEKTVLVINRAVESPSKNQKGLIIAPNRIQNFLKRPVEGIIPIVDEMLILKAFYDGVPVIASSRDMSKSPMKQLTQLSDHLYATLMGIEELDIDDDQPQEKRSSWLPFGR
ncbi:MAG: response regulator [Anaerolineae bacterium]|nr:response regulator [Anaerolineae bacterium]